MTRCLVIVVSKSSVRTRTVMNTMICVVKYHDVKWNHTSRVGLSRCRANDLVTRSIEYRRYRDVTELALVQITTLEIHTENVNQSIDVIRCTQRCDSTDSWDVVTLM